MFYKEMKISYLVILNGLNKGIDVGLIVITLTLSLSYQLSTVYHIVVGP